MRIEKLPNQSNAKKESNSSTNEREGKGKTRKREKGEKRVGGRGGGEGGDVRRH